MITQAQMNDRAEAHLLQSAETKRLVADECMDSLVSVAQLLADSFRSGGKLLLCGNGGSAADCQHIAAEFVSVLTQDFKRPGLKAIALTTDTSFLTAYANDFGYEGAFARQVETLGSPGNILIGTSTSGNSKNVLSAMEIAKKSICGPLVLRAAAAGFRTSRTSLLLFPAKVLSISRRHILRSATFCAIWLSVVFLKANMG